MNCEICTQKTTVKEWSKFKEVRLDWIPNLPWEKPMSSFLISLPVLESTLSVSSLIVPVLGMAGLYCPDRSGNGLVKFICV